MRSIHLSQFKFFKMKLTKEVIEKIQDAMNHTKKDGSINWKDDDEIEVNLAGTFAADKFIVIKNKTKDPVISAEPHPNFDYEKKEFKKDEGPEPPEGMAPVGKPRKAPIGFDPGKEGEFDYRIPRNFQEGGLASLEMDATEMNDKELINKAIDAIQNELPNPEEVLGVFIARFGEEALADLVRKVQDGTFDDTVERSEGMIDGMGDGMDDMVPAKLEGQDDVLLSDGEFIVPADVVSGLGNGSSKAGSDRLYDMMDRVRQMRTGTTEQPDDVPTEQMMPA